MSNRPRHYDPEVVAATGTAIFAGVSAVYLLGISWNRWTEPLVDFGAQVYCAALVARGQSPYLDFAFYNGPLSVWVNGLWFAIGGSETLGWLMVLNAIWLLVLCGLLWKAFSLLGSPSTGWVALTAFVWFFALQRLSGINSYNYLCPYAHEHIHGLALTFAGLLLLHSARHRALWVAAGAICIGMVFLTKAENSLAATGAALTMMFLNCRDESFPGLVRLRSAIVFGAAYLTPILAAWLKLASAMPASEAALGVAGSWGVVFRSDVRELLFFRLSMGTDRPVDNLLTMLGVFCLSAIILAALWFLSRPAYRNHWWPILAGLLLGVVVAGGLAGDVARCYLTFRALPLWMVSIAAASVWSYGSASRTSLPKTTWIWWLTLAVFSGLLLGKVALRARIFHYGFALAMPATLLALCGLWDGGGQLRRGVTRAFLVPVFLGIALTLHIQIQRPFLNEPVTVVESRMGRIVADGRQVPTIAAAVAWCRNNISQRETLLCVPEGIMLNYLAERRSPSRFTNFMPTEVLLFGEAAILSDLRQNSPDWIIIAPKNTDEWGVRFGQGFLDQTILWIENNYDKVATIQGPMTDYRMIVLRRRAAHFREASRPASSLRQ